MRLIFLSPHLDDAVLSAGGLIHDLAAVGTRVEVWTIMSGMPAETQLSAFAAEMHAKWGTTTVGNTLQVRQAEDRRATSRLGAEAVYLDFLDAIYRRGPDGQPLYAEPVGAALHPADLSLAAQIAAQIRNRTEAGDALVCPLAIGAHVDHVIVRRAAEALGRPLRYSADLPYVLYHPDELGPGTSGLISRLYPVSESGFGAWLEAIQLYDSQLSTLYENREMLKEAVRQYWLTGPGIRLWSREDVPLEPGLDSAPKS